MRRWALWTRINLTLQKKILLLAVAGMSLGLGLFSWLGLQYVDWAVDRTLDERLTMSRLMAAQMDSQLTFALAQMEHAARFQNDVAIETQFAAASRSLDAVIAGTGLSIKNLVLFDRDSRIILIDHERPGAAGMDLSSYSEVSAAMKAERPMITNLSSVPVADQPVVLFTAPVLNDEGEVTGMLCAAIDLQYLNAGVLGQSSTLGKTGFIEFVDGNGVVLGRTSQGSIPKQFELSDHPGRFAQLIQQGTAVVRTCHRCHSNEGNLERRKDVIAFAPLSSASWGVAIRQSEGEALAPARELRRKIVVAGCIIGAGTLLLVWLFMRSVVKPLRLLTAAVRRVETGDFQVKIPIRGEDEIGKLSSAFNSMTGQLTAARDDLVSRNEELSALNAMISVVNKSLSLENVLGSAMQSIGEATGAKAICVFLRSADGRRLEKRWIDESGVFRCDESASAQAGCACHQVLGGGRTLIVNDVSQCPHLGSGSADTAGIGFFISIPLKSQDRTVGVMNLAEPDEEYRTQHGLEFLDAVGYHVGMAIENSALYEESKRIEELRGQLLSSVIDAQEEERKRIARELHDEYGQTLTGLIMSIESLEQVPNPSAAEFGSKLARAKAIAVRALEDLRRLLLDLRPTMLDDLGLISAIRDHVQGYLAAKGLQVQFESSGQDSSLTPAVETAIFRIVQEATHNIVKHANAHHVEIMLAIGGDELVLDIRDDGVGFDLDAAHGSRQRTPSMGFLGIRERAKLLGGSIVIESRAGLGTHLTVRIPVNQVRTSPEAGKEAEAWIKSGS